MQEKLFGTTSSYEILVSTPLLTTKPLTICFSIKDKETPSIIKSEPKLSICTSKVLYHGQRISYSSLKSRTIYLDIQYISSAEPKLKIEVVSLSELQSAGEHQEEEAMQYCQLCWHIHP